MSVQDALRTVAADVRWLVKGWVWRRIDNAVAWWLQRDLKRITEPTPGCKRHPVARRTRKP